MNTERPKYRKWKRKAGGGKICPKCGRKHAAVMRVNGRVMRPKNCIDCGAALPKILKRAGKAAVQWYVRVTDPAAGAERDIACESSEAADDLIRQLERDWTPDPVQTWVLEHVSAIARGITADDRDEALNVLITKLGGDPTARKLKPVGLDEAIESICSELRTKGNASEVYICEARRVAKDFLNITAIGAWSDAGVEHVKKYAAVLSEGGFLRDGRNGKKRKARPATPHTRAKCLRTLRAIIGRMVDNGWVHPAITGNASGRVWLQATNAVDHEYLPDAVFSAVVNAAGEDRWLRTLLLVAYNTAARLGDLLRITWADVDLDGTSEVSGRSIPTVRISNSKTRKRSKNKDALFIPLDAMVIGALRELRANPKAVCHRHVLPEVAAIRRNADGLAADSEHVFSTRGFRDPRNRVSTLVADLFVKAGFVDADNNPRWTLHDLRRKANMDIMRAGGTIREAMSLTGHSSPSVNICNYQSAADLERMAALTSAMSGFRGLKLVKESA